MSRYYHMIKAALATCQKRGNSIPWPKGYQESENTEDALHVSCQIQDQDKESDQRSPIIHPKRRNSVVSGMAIAQPHL